MSVPLKFQTLLFQVRDVPNVTKENASSVCKFRWYLAVAQERNELCFLNAEPTDFPIISSRQLLGKE